MEQWNMGWFVYGIVLKNKPGILVLWQKDFTMQHRESLNQKPAIPCPNHKPYFTHLLEGEILPWNMRLLVMFAQANLIPTTQPDTYSSVKGKTLPHKFGLVFWYVSLLFLVFWQTSRETMAILMIFISIQ